MASRRAAGAKNEGEPPNVAGALFDVGTLGGTDTLYARLLQADGTLTGWQSFTVIAPPDHAPVVTAPNAAIATGHSVAASSLFSVTDADGDTITEYALYDATGSGHFVVNGAPHSAN